MLKTEHWNLRTILLYFHTLRHLRPVQFYGRLRLWLPQAEPDLDPAPGLRPKKGVWVLPAARASSMEGESTFRFLNESGEVRDASDWNDSLRDKLWLYNLHYFYDLNAIGSGERRDWHRGLIRRWIEENPPATGVGWEPYPTSLRIVNWIKWKLADNGLAPAWLDSLAVQARWLARHIEWHLLGNHLFANAKALVFAGLFFEGEEADQWLQKGLDILSREIPEQVLQDGGHFERSPMYHALVLEDLLDLFNLAHAYPGSVSEHIADEWRECTKNMLRWLAGMVHPDGGIAFFNDAAFGIAPDYEALSDYAERLALPGSPPDFGSVTHFVDSGYIRLQQNPVVALLDVAPVGPDYLPGHAHADTLSFELSLGDQRVIVNSGTSCYGTSEERTRQRGTAAHSTVQVDGEDSSEVWAGFRVAKRALPFGLEIEEVDDEPVVCCAHDGYRRLRGRPVHHRQWILKPDRLIVTDSIRGSFREAVARFFLHPDVVVEGSGVRGSLRLSDGQSLSWAVDGGEVFVVGTIWHPEFGCSVPNHCLELRFEGRRAVVEFTWS